MDVLLIYPSVTTSSIESSVKIPPLGLAYLGAVLELAGYSVKIIDMNTSWYDMSTQSMFEIEKPRIVGITCLTPFYSEVLRIAKLAKSYGSKVIVGGAHATAMPDELLRSGYIDSVVLGEGELAITAIVDDWFNDQIVTDKVKWDYYIHNLDSIPFPARHLLSLEEYHSPQLSGKKVTSILTSRGCPYSCTFCDYRFLMGNKFRRRNPAYVVREIMQCIKEYGIDHFSFRDSTFTFDEKWIDEFCNLIIESNLKFTWDCNGRVNLVTERMLKRMKETGCNLISYGIESGSQCILDIVHKQTKVEQSYTAIKMTQKIGIEALSYFILGLPTENWDTINSTIEHAKRLNSDYTQFSLATPFPGTPMYDYAVENNFIRDGVSWDDFTPLKKAIMRTKDLDFWELEKALKIAYRSYYVRPRYIWNRFKKLRPSNLKQNFNGLKTLIGQQSN